MRKVLLILLACVLVYALVGLLAIYLPPEVKPVASASAASYAPDRPCLRYLRRSGVPRSERRQRCRVRVREVNVSQAAGEWFKWTVGNCCWRFFVEVSYHQVLVGSSAVWIVDDVYCYKGQVLLVSLDLENCRSWSRKDDKHAGTSYVLTLGPVQEGHRTYIVLAEDDGIKGPYYE